LNVVVWQLPYLLKSGYISLRHVTMYHRRPGKRPSIYIHPSSEPLSSFASGFVSTGDPSCPRKRPRTIQTPLDVQSILDTIEFPSNPARHDDTVGLSNGTHTPENFEVSSSAEGDVGITVQIAPEMLRTKQYPSSVGVMLLCLFRTDSGLERTSFILDSVSTRILECQPVAGG
jgi:hypothetical protein